MMEIELAEKILIGWISIGAALLLAALFIISAFYQVKFEKPTPSDLFLVAACLVLAGGIGALADSESIWPLIVAAMGALVCLFASLRLHRIMMR